MLASTPTSDYISLRTRTRDHSMSPSCRAVATPPRLKNQHSYDSPMLTPSPLRGRPQRPLFLDHGSSGDLGDTDDIFLQSPFRSPSAPRGLRAKPHPISLDDDEGAIFLSTASTPSSSSTPFFPASSSQPLRTPVKQAHRVPSRTALSIKHTNTQPHVPATGNRVVPGGTGGMKRKSTPLASSFTTPLRHRTFTPLSVSQARSTADGSSPAGGIVFDRLAPLPAPRFTARTPQSKAETDTYMRRHTESMTRLRICDLDDSGDEFGGKGDGGDDSGCELEAEEGLFSSGGSQSTKNKSGSVGRQLALQLLIACKGKGNEEVVEAISPDGHVNKRRARSRPVSLELLESVKQTPSPSVSREPANAKRASANAGSIAFPSITHVRQRTTSKTTVSSSEAGSPLPRRRVSGATSNVHLQPPSLSPDHGHTRAPLNRMTSGSSATLFFGPPVSPSARKRTSTASSIAAAGALAQTVATRRTAMTQPKIMNRHSYAGTGFSPLPWGSRPQSPSPCSSPALTSAGDEDEDMFFNGEPQGPQDSSFVFSVTEGTPSPRSKKAGGGLPKKYKPRDSGVVLSDDEDASMNMGGHSGDYLSVMPASSTSVGSMNSVNSDEDRLVTPGLFPSAASGWPHAVVISGSDDGDKGEGGVDVDAFILKTLAAGPKGVGEGAKKVPGTPVKKIKTSLHARLGDRPWQSAVAAKVSGFGFGFETGKKKNKPPRKSMPAAFPALGARKGAGSRGAGSDTEEEEEFNSPSARKDGRYEGVGIGRPGAGGGGARHWLMRRSSSGAFSSGSDASISTIGTPTRLAGRDWHLPPPRVLTQFSPSDSKLKSVQGGDRSASGSSSSSVATLNSPTATRHFPISAAASRRTPLPTQTPPSEGKLGRFESDFVEVDEVGSGEFGKVMKVRYKEGRDDDVFAVKKSKQFEGVRHRLRLREEVDILQHLSRITPNGQHSNVLAYIDSWEQDEALYIQTELCELGNFARFLWEYGRAFPRLDEARVWKIFVDLSNGLRFIHDSAVIHLDLKPANIFVTGEGRFKIGDFGMASLWPRPKQDRLNAHGGFEREGDKNYLAPEVLQGKYGKAADIFSFGMTMLETAANIVVPDQGEPWHRLRQEDFGQVDLDRSPELFHLIKSMMRTDPALRVDMPMICSHPVVLRARLAMERTYADAKAKGSSVFAASPLAGVPETFLEEILGRPPMLDDGAMDLSP